MGEIAIIGLSCLFPDASTPEEFWKNLTQGRDSCSAITEREMGVDTEAYYDPTTKGAKDKYYCSRGGYIRDFSFDPRGFELSAELLTHLDDSFTWSLHVAREALRDSGYLGSPDKLNTCGVLLGCLSFPTKSSNELFLPHYDRVLEDALRKLFDDASFALPRFSSRARSSTPLNGLMSGYPAAVVAKALKLSELCFSLDAACASSLYVVKLACDYLLSGRADMMLAGAVSAADPFFVQMGFSIFNAHPFNAVSAPFDKASQGLYASQGAGMFVLKRYEDAVRDGDTIYATIPGGGLSNDGRGQFVLSPNTKGQVAAFERAYANAGADPKEIDCVECHATGTPRGDRVELESMDAYFGAHDARPLVGSVKSNVGHLLTSAGMAGMIKVILGMQHGEIPPTINVRDPLTSSNRVIDKDKIVTENNRWPESRKGKCAAVSAFGFGGCNAHVILKDGKEPSPAPTNSSPQSAVRNEPLAIVGMDAHFGRFADLKSFHDAIQDGDNAFVPLPPSRWKGFEKYYPQMCRHGAYIDNFEVDLRRFKIPPKEEELLVPQQLLMMKVADKALIDSGIAEGGKTAVIVGMGADPSFHLFRGRVNLTTQMQEACATWGGTLDQSAREELENIAKNSIYEFAGINRFSSFIGNIIASRIASLWDFSGPAFTVSIEENSTFRALEVAQMFLANGDADAVVVGAVDLAGSFESVLLHSQMHELNAGPHTMSFDRRVNGWTIGEGAGALVLKRLSDARKDHDRIYATLDALACARGIDEIAVSEAAGRACCAARCDSSDVGYLEVHASGMREQDEAEMRGLLEGYKTAKMANKSLALGSAKATIGHAFSAAGIASVIKTALCIHHRFIPATPGWSEPKFPGLLSSNAFYVPEVSRAWPEPTSGHKRRAAISGLGMDEVAFHLVMAEAPAHAVRDRASPERHEGKSQVLTRSITLGGLPLDKIILSDENKQRFRKRSAQIAIGKEENKPAMVATRVSCGEAGKPDKGMSALVSCMNAAHESFLESRRTAMNELGRMIEDHQAAMLPVCSGTRDERTNSDKHDEGVIWDQKDLIEFAEGKIAKVFGPEYAIIDEYQRRVRLPTTDYLLVSRVTKLDATTNEFKPSSITTEYEIPYNAWYAVDGQIPWAVAVESGQCDLLLISYLGIDFQNRGDRVYRLLDCTLTFMDEIPKEGSTLRYDIRINSFAKSGDSLLFFFEYDCYVGDREVLTMRGGCAGFFTDKELAEGKGVIQTEEEIAERRNAPKRSFVPLLSCPKKSFDRNDLLQIIKGNPTGCFGPAYDQHGLNTSLRFAAEKMLMFDRVVEIDAQGGAWGLGLIEAEKILEPDHWYFPCHFKDDEVLAGSLMAEGCCQLLQFYILYLGLQTETKDARFQPIPHLPQQVRCRGQVTPQRGVMTYRMEVTDIGIEPVPFAKANVEIILDGKTIVDFKNVGVQLSEKSESETLSVADRSLNTVPDTLPFTSFHVSEFATGSLAKCFGTEYDVYEGRKAPRTPNGDLQLISRVLEIEGKRHELKPGSNLVAQYDVPHDAWYFRQNIYPSLMPYSIYMEIALQPCGFLTAYLGSTLTNPDVSFFFRNLDGTGDLLKHVDLRGTTITNYTKLVSSTISGDTIIQSFEYDLQTGGETFFKGTAAFGYFVADALRNQKGLDSGRNVQPWHEKENIPVSSLVTLRLASEKTQRLLYDVNATKPHYRLPGNQLEFLDEVTIVNKGGTSGLGYVYAVKDVDPTDWFYSCHFFEDPVMPGSLGVQSIIEALQVFALYNDLGAGFASPYFAHRLGTTVWKYRGQIIPTNKRMTLEVQVTNIEKTPERVTVMADANLYKDGLRIYEVKDVSFCIEEAGRQG